MPLIARRYVTESLPYSVVAGIPEKLATANSGSLPKANLKGKRLAPLPPLFNF